MGAASFGAEAAFVVSRRSRSCQKVMALRDWGAYTAGLHIPNDLIPALAL